MSEPDAQGRQRILGTAAGHAYMWAEAVTVQSRRVFDTSSVTVTHLADAVLLALAVRNVLRAAELALSVAEGDEAEGLRAAVEDFKAALPDATRLRNVLDHFDDYALGTGLMQRHEKTPTAYPVFFERSDVRYVLHVGPLSIDVALEAQAAESLASAIFVTLR